MWSPSYAGAFRYGGSPSSAGRCNAPPGRPADPLANPRRGHQASPPAAPGATAAGEETPEIRKLVEAAWLAGYGGRRDLGVSLDKGREARQAAQMDKNISFLFGLQLLF